MAKVYVDLLYYGVYNDSCL